MDRVVQKIEGYITKVVKFLWIIVVRKLKYESLVIFFTYEEEDVQCKNDCTDSKQCKRNGKDFRLQLKEEKKRESYKHALSNKIEWNMFNFHEIINGFAFYLWKIKNKRSGHILLCPFSFSPLFIFLMSPLQHYYALHTS